MQRPAAILLMGPTGAGKTELAVRLAERWPLEIVSVDSAMVYRGMDIGTAKPPAALRARVPHHLIDLLDPSESYSAARFVSDATRAMREIAGRGRVPLLTGGTMLYFRALQAGLARLPAADPGLRRRLEDRAAIEGWPALHGELRRRDPQAATRIAPGDRQRIQRALEVLELTGQPITVRQRENLRGAHGAADLRLVLAPERRDLLAARLEARFRHMMELGLLAEVQALHERGDLHAGLPAMRLIGYRQLWAYLDGRVALDEAVQMAIVATRQYARRQLTWLRAEPEARWFEALDPATPEAVMGPIRAWLAAKTAES
ncbi:MAG: tRNA (adenosine(37)-N6)-dimethylallyltransferase MiaA [Gammaproteobacteria bacterium]|nr:tRNA (adenosine(37)-N6)-dimethylallyltransferase MiaA [Gammaproteobacteria bacterium]